jgi:hypothetical protein
MAERVTVTWQGRRYEAVRSGGNAAGPEPGQVWQVTREGAPVTTLPAQEGEDAGEVREKIHRWLEANESRPATDVGRQ